MARLRWLCYLLLLTSAVFLNGCASLYFRKAGEPPPPPPNYTLSNWPYEEYWTGIVFNGSKIGFTHLSLSPAKDASKSFEILSKASFRLRFLMLDKRVSLYSHDRVAEDLTLEHFTYDYDLDGNRLKLLGTIKAGRLEVEIVTRDQTKLESIPVEGKLYPMSTIDLYPVFHGLELGRRYFYQVYDGETQTIARVEQEILAYEESDLFHGKAFKVKTRLHGQSSTTWIDVEGRPLLEMSLGGVLISSLESEVIAKQYLTQGALNKKEILLDFSLIRSNISISEPESVKLMKVALYGIDEGTSMPTDEIQQCERRGGEVFCRISMERPDEYKETHMSNPIQSERYLQPSYIVPSRDPLIRKTARKITADAKSTLERLSLLVEWMQKNIEKEPVDVFTALDVLSGKKAECQGHSFLFAAFARALDIPTRVVNGIVYSKEFEGFLYHTWAESQVNGWWVAIDPTFGQLPADATHIKLIEGEKPSDLLPLVNLIGRIQVRIISVDSY